MHRIQQVFSPKIGKDLTENERGTSEDCSEYFQYCDLLFCCFHVNIHLFLSVRQQASSSVVIKSASWNFVLYK